MQAFQIILAFLPGFAWLFFYMQEDPQKEPKQFIALTFLAGMGAAVAALFVEFGAQHALSALDVERFSMIALLVFSAIEEFMKFFFTKLSVKNNPAFNTPIDAMIYMVVGALGFATIENLGSILGAGGQTGTALLNSIFEIVSFRFVGATLLHTLTSGLIGYYWAKSIRSFGAKTPLIKGFLVAIILHAIFNYLIVVYGTVIFPILFLIVVGFFVLGDFERIKHTVI